MPSLFRLSPRHAVFCVCLALLALAVGGCGHMPRMPKMLGGSGNVELRLDGEQSHEAKVPVGCTLTLDLRDPKSSGYVFAGTVFDTGLLRLDGIEPTEGGARVRYLFMVLAAGESEVQIKIRKSEPGYRPDVYKRVRVTSVQ